MTSPSKVSEIEPGSQDVRDESKSSTSRDECEGRWLQRMATSVKARTDYDRQCKTDLMPLRAISRPFCRLGSPAGSNRRLSCSTRRISCGLPVMPCDLSISESRLLRRLWSNQRTSHLSELLRNPRPKARYADLPVRWLVSDSRFFVGAAARGTYLTQGVLIKPLGNKLAHVLQRKVESIHRGKTPDQFSSSVKKHDIGP